VNEGELDAARDAGVASETAAMAVPLLSNPTRWFKIMPGHGGNQIINENINGGYNVPILNTGGVLDLNGAAETVAASPSPTVIAQWFCWNRLRIGIVNPPVGLFVKVEDGSPAEPLRNTPLVMAEAVNCFRQHHSSPARRQYLRLAHYSLH